MKGRDTGVDERREEFVRPSTTQGGVLREIRQAIMSRRLEPGQWIRQWDIAERLKVSSVPVREALKTLEAEGQVTYEPYRGYRVVELSREQLEEIYVARGLLEAELTRRAAERIDVGLVEHLERTLARMEELARAGDVVGYTEANLDFHFAIFHRADLPRIYHMVEVLWQNSDSYRGLIFSPVWYETAREDHEEIMAACRARDVAGIIAAQERHRQNALRSINLYLEEAEGRAAE